MSFELEQVLAAQAAGYTRIDYEQLPGADWWIVDVPDSKAAVIARYRMQSLLEAIKWDSPPPKK